MLARLMNVRCVSALLLAVALPAHAGLFDDDEARARIEKLRTDVNAITQKVETGSKNQLEFANQIEALKADLAKLRGQIEVMTFDLETSQKRQKDFYIDLDNRLRKLEPQADASADAPKEGAKVAVDEVAATKDYEAALNFIKAARYRDAIGAFTAFIKNFQGSERTPSAYFWLGSSHYQLREFAKSADQFGKVAANWPKDPKAPDAMLGQANAQFDGGDNKGGRKTLEALIAKYPKSSAAEAARQRLKKK